MPHIARVTAGTDFITKGPFMSSRRSFTPVLVIGAGLAGCITALRLADQGIEVALICSGVDEENANSWLAQGGIIYRGPDNDSKLLEADIMAAGHGLNNPEAVRFLARKGPDAVEELLVERLGVPFDRLAAGTREGEWDLTREGGHSTQRIIHCRDHTGQCIMDCLLTAVKESPRIKFLKGYTAIDLLTSLHHTTGMTYRYRLQNLCCGAYVYNENESRVEVMLAAKTVLATGGVGQVYLHTTNTSTANGSGISMASRALVRVEGMEYVQFHPTTLFHLEPRRVLITEALRGEGAVLINARGERFMEGKAERAELAPRDVVSQAIMDELYSTGEPCVFLDATALGASLLEERFPTVLKSCLERGIDARKQPIPVVPAEHYLCGGILTDLAGRTTLENLYSVGECSCTGVHGANRLASTSLLEAVLWGKSAAEDIYDRLDDDFSEIRPMLDAIQDWRPIGTEMNDDPVLIAQDWATIKNTMWNYVGITRTRARLDRAFKEIRELSRHVHDFYKRTPISKPVIDLFHGCQAAYLITQAALRNRDKIGCHNRV